MIYVGKEMSKTRKIKKVFKSRATREGAGVHLRRVFGFNEVPLFDPFLLLDDFRSDNPDHYIKGFPWHPHRGIETITYVFAGEVEHGDSLGNKGIIGPGDVQWMTAGSGIIHQEMPKGDPEGRMYGFQLWANLPSHSKMTDPRYQEIKSSQIPEIRPETGIVIRIIAGDVDGVKGPIQDDTIEPGYIDISVPPNSEYRHPTKTGHNVFVYVFDGGGFYNSEKDAEFENGTLVLFDEGDEVVFSTSKKPLRFLLISGKPIGEPVAWYGPIVMNTEGELKVAFSEYQEGTFIKHGEQK